MALDFSSVMDVDRYMEISTKRVKPTILDIVLNIVSNIEYCIVLEGYCIEYFRDRKKYY